MDESEKYPKAPSGCPNCDSDSLSCEGTTHEDEIIIKYYICQECETSWNELYRFVNFKID